MSELFPFLSSNQYIPKNETLFLQAITHRSYLKSNPEFIGHNEILEFLGDAVLGLVVGEWLIEKFPEEDEGKISRKRASLVNEDNLFQLSTKLGLADHLRVGAKENREDLINNPRILASTFEAILGAMFKDRGYEITKDWLYHLLNLHFQNFNFSADFALDYKTRLQEHVQEKFKVTPEYKVINEKGPEHKKMFCSQVTKDGVVIGEGMGNSKKMAEQNAAYSALKKMGQV